MYVLGTGGASHRCFGVKFEKCMRMQALEIIKCVNKGASTIEKVFFNLQHFINGLVNIYSELTEYRCNRHVERLQKIEEETFFCLQKSNSFSLMEDTT